MTADRSRTLSLTLIAISQVLALSAWFAGAAALPSLEAHAQMNAFTQAALSSAVQLGFVMGALTSAALGLADRFDARHVFAFGAGLAGLLSLGALITPAGSCVMIMTRFGVGAALALVYPVGMKLAASWAKGDAGLLIGLLVGALTLGSASPHLALAVTDQMGWKAPFLVSGLGAMASAWIILGAHAGPAFKRAPKFDPAAFKLTLTQPALLRVNLGYLGHMWELYAFWAWVGVFLSVWIETRALDPGVHESVLTFTIIAAGALGALAAGWIADRAGRTLVTSAAMAVSGSCAVATALVWAGPPVLMGAILIIYGVTIIADSAQFSAAAAELAPDDKAGSILTLQTALGFALTLITVQLLPLWSDVVGWRFAFWPLAIGPALGVWAMVSLRSRPEAVKLANGRR